MSNEEHTPEPKTKEELEKLHDLLDELLFSPDFQNWVEPEVYIWSWATRDALCYALGHKLDGDSSKTNLETIMESMLKEYLEHKMKGNGQYLN